MSSPRYAQVLVGSLRDALDHEGCAFGQVTRERVDNVLARVQNIEAKVNMIAAGVALQLIGFLFAVILFTLNHAR